MFDAQTIQSGRIWSELWTIWSTSDGTKEQLSYAPRGFGTPTITVLACSGRVLVDLRLLLVSELVVIEFCAASNYINSSILRMIFMGLSKSVFGLRN